MKIISRQEFAGVMSLPVDFDGAFGSKPVDPAVEYGWLASLPIAGAIFRLVGQNVDHVISNRMFDDLALGFRREAGLGHIPIKWIPNCRNF